jgi:hypothetical protein
MISSICVPLRRKIAVNDKAGRNAWETASWDGSRRVQLRAALSMTIRQRLQMLEALTGLAQRLAAMPRNTKRAAKRTTAR